MTEATVVYTDESDSQQAGIILGTRVRETLVGQADVVVLFLSPRYQHAQFLQSFKATCKPRLLIGCSSAGEFITDSHGEGAACALGLRSTEMSFAVGIGHELKQSYTKATREVLNSFTGRGATSFHYRSALVLADARAGHTDELLELMTLQTDGKYQFFGGGAGDNAQFQHTPVFYDTEVVSNAVVALEILSHKPLGVGVRHGWEPASQELRVTEVDGMRLVKINDRPAIEAFQAHANEIGEMFDPADPLPFFLHNLIGIETGLAYKLRVPLAVEPDGSIVCAAEIPPNSIIRIMDCSRFSARDAAVEATEVAIRKLYGSKPAAALFFDCVATRLRMGKEFGFELDGIQKTLGNTKYVGCNTHGQIARAPGQFSGFHNCTAVVCLIPA